MAQMLKELSLYHCPCVGLTFLHAFAHHIKASHLHSHSPHIPSYVGELTRFSTRHQSHKLSIFSNCRYNCPRVRSGRSWIYPRTFLVGSYLPTSGLTPVVNAWPSPSSHSEFMHYRCRAGQTGYTLAIISAVACPLDCFNKRPVIW